MGSFISLTGVKSSSNTRVSRVRCAPWQKYFRCCEADLFFASVPPAELEGLLLTHPDIADAAVIGVESAKEATELPRYD